MSNIPKLRFPEFNGEWEEKRFGDILSLNMVPVPKPDTEYERLGIFCHNKGTFFVAEKKLFIYRTFCQNHIKSTILLV